MSEIDFTTSIELPLILEKSCAKFSSKSRTPKQTFPQSFSKIPVSQTIPICSPAQKSAFYAKSQQPLLAVTYASLLIPISCEVRISAKLPLIPPKIVRKFPTRVGKFGKRCVVALTMKLLGKTSPKFKSISRKQPVLFLLWGKFLETFYKARITPSLVGGESRSTAKLRISVRKFRTLSRVFEKLRTVFFERKVPILTLTYAFETSPVFAVLTPSPITLHAIKLAKSLISLTANISTRNRETK